MGDVARRGPFSARRRIAAGHGPNVCGAQALRSLFNLEIHDRALLEIVEIHPDQTGTVEEHFLAIIASNEPESAISNDLRDSPASHRVPHTDAN